MAQEPHDVIRQSIPAVRIAVAKILKSKYKMGQADIAKRMGITQAAVNKYLNGRYSSQITKIVTGVRAAGYDKKIATMVASGKKISLINENIDRAASAIYMKAIA